MLLANMVSNFTSREGVELSYAVPPGSLHVPAGKSQLETLINLFVNLYRHEHRLALSQHLTENGLDIPNHQQSLHLEYFL